ncbi:MAG: hypothetical protein OXC60_12895 [Litoreibacter sp.]|nr:hypothetical protein [Litoreibacter sp.]
MSLAPETRLSLFFASENDSAVILLRAKRRLFGLFSWDRKTDQITDGQWLKRQVISESCALSPDGRHFLYSVYDGRMDQPAGEAYTAISKPPYFTALALFPATYSWSVGGQFLSNRLYQLADDVQARDMIDGQSELERVVKGAISKDCKTGLRLLNGRPAPLNKQQVEIALGRVTVAPTKEMDRYDTLNGALHRIASDGSLELIRDFKGLDFKPIRAPYDTRAEGDTSTDGWHPLDGETL